MQNDISGHGVYRTLKRPLERTVRREPYNNTIKRRRQINRTYYARAA